MWEFLTCVLQQSYLPRWLGIKGRDDWEIMDMLAKVDTFPSIWVIQGEQDSVVLPISSIGFVEGLKQALPEVPVLLTLQPGDHAGADVILGAIAFGNFDIVVGQPSNFPNIEKVAPMLDAFQAHGHDKIDTARIYGSGQSEQLLATAEWEKRGLRIETKIYPTKFRPLLPNNAAYNFGAEDLRAGLLASLKALNSSKIDTWYLYAPDRSTPFEETARAINQLYKEGLFSRWGVCNYRSWEVAQLQEVCMKNGWVRPAVYQSIYNAVCRDIEAELVPCLRHYGMSLEAGQPLASGLLTYQYRRDMSDPADFHPGSRFNPDPRNFIANHQRSRYWHDAYFDALDIIHQAAQEHDLTDQECALRWLRYHSALKQEFGDGLIVGASSLQQFKENLVDLDKGPLPAKVVEAMELAGKKCGAVPIAIIGMACRFSGGVGSPEQLWKLCAEGESGWSEIPESRFSKEAFYHPDAEKMNTTHAKGGYFLKDDVGLFDAAFFNVSAETAASLDPQYRLQLESTYEAFESAGITVQGVAGSNTSMFGGTFFHDYQDGAMRDPDTLPRFLMVGCGTAMASNRISHFYDLRGTSFSLDTGCSTTLTALHQACQNLRAGESDMSVVGGANVMLNPDNFVAMSSLRLISADGKSYAFDSRASGYGRGEGSATVIIKRLDDAIRDGDPIRAVIRGTGCNQDGKTDTITTPSQRAQEELMRKVYETSKLDPSETTYFEAHGTGTPTGDPIECRAVASLFKDKRPVDKPLRIGSVKTNVGHTETASGLAAIIKVALALEKGQIPPSINFKTLNPNLHFDEWNMKVPTQLESWQGTEDGIRRASVNNFGYGGANAHIIMEDYDTFLATSKRITSGYTNGNTNGHLASTNGSANGTTNGFTNGITNGVNGHTEHATNGVNGNHSISKSRVFVLSAKDDQVTRTMAQNLKAYLKSTKIEDEESFLDNLAYTLGQRRSLFPWIVTQPASSVPALITALESDKLVPIRANGKPKIGFVFTGQGAQWFAMGRELIKAYPVFRDCLWEADTYLKDFGSPWSLMEELLRDEKASRVNEIVLSMPLCAAVQIALVCLLRSWGVTPTGVTSHSSGEIAAAFAAGALSLKSAMAIVFARASLASERGGNVTRQGGMTAVGLSAKDVEEKYIPHITEGKIVVACLNSPTSITASGDIPGLDQLETMLVEDNVFARRLKVDAAYHSHHMQDIAEPYLVWLEKVLHAESAMDAGVIYTSPTTGERMRNGDILCTPQHWVDSLVSPVQFVKSCTEMCLADEFGASGTPDVDLIIEVGPHAALAGPITEITKQPEFEGTSISYLSCLVRKTNAVDTMQNLACNLIKSGYPIDLGAVNFPGNKSVLSVIPDLPSYPWNHKTRFWAETRYNKTHRFKNDEPHDLLGSLAIGTNVLAPSWRHIVRPQDLPWLRDHVVQGNILYPGAGYICMAIEGACQAALSSTTSEKRIKGYHLRDIDILAALIVPDTIEGVEMQLNFRPCSDNTIYAKGIKEFHIFSVSSENKWTEHCKGLISIEFEEDEASWTAPVEKTSMLKGPQKMEEYRRRLDPRDIYSSIRSVGIYHGPIFQQLKKIRSRSKQSVSVFEVANTVDVMPFKAQHPHVVHPITLDNVFQAAYTALPGAGAKMTTTLLPKSIQHLWVSHSMKSDPGHLFRAYSNVNRASSQSFDIDMVITENSDDENVPLVTIDGFSFQSIGEVLGDQSVPYENEKFSYVKWAPDLTLASSEGLSKQISYTAVADEAYSLNDLKRPSMNDIDAVLAEMKAADVEPLSLKKMKHQAELVETLMIDRCNRQIGELVKHIAHINPRAKILEVGAGAGATTVYALKALGDTSDPLAALYDFTDISTASFDGAKQAFEPWKDLMRFKRLDIDQSPEPQGFEAHTYDLIIASRVISKTKSLGHAIASIRSLLKPGGKLVLTEATRHQIDGQFIQGLLPSPEQGDGDGHNESVLSLDEWNHVLLSNDFSGVETELRDCDNDDISTFSSMLSTATSNTTSFDLEVALVSSSPGPPASWLEHLGSSISKITGKVPKVETLESVDATNKIVIFLAEIEHPLLKAPTKGQFEAIRKVCTTSKGLLWVSRGAAIEGDNVDASLQVGFLRTLRVEYVGKRLASFDLDPKQDLWAMDSASALTNVFRKVFDYATNEQMSDFEFAERDGVILIPRYFKDEVRNKAIFPDNSDHTTPQLEPYFQSSRPLRLNIGSVGDLETLAFDDDPEVADDLPADFLEVKPKAFGVTYRDVMIAMGQYQDAQMGCESSGIISRVGSTTASLGFKPGDRVALLTDGHYGNLIRAHWTSAVHIPDSMSFEVAASIPTAYALAYVSLFSTARLQIGESILIHTATSGFGQAAIVLAKHVGAEIFVTVGSAAKSKFIAEMYGIPEDHIFSSRSVSFTAAVMSKTNGKGVDVVLNTLAGALMQASFDCVAPFGRFVQVRKDSSRLSSCLDMGTISRAVSFTSVDLAAMMQYRSQEISRVLSEIMTLFRKEMIFPVQPAVYSISDVQTAFGLLQSDGHIGKLVLAVKKDDLVPVVPKILRARLRADCSYLIVGGIGGIGQAICYWMAERGAKSLIVLSRSANAGDKNRQFVADMAKASCTVKFVSCDVSVKDDLARAVESCALDMPPIRGVIQGAMVLRDSVLEQMSFDDWNGGIRPKVDGSWNLHEVFSTHTLDFFIMLSSLAGVFGIVSQTNYGAGGTFQDALAQYRTRRGLPGAAIDIGVVKSVGVVAENDNIDERLRKSGHTLLSEDDVLGAIESAITSPPSCPMMLGLNPGPGHHWEDSGMARDLRFAAIKYKQSTLSISSANKTASDELGGLIAAAETFDDAVSAAVGGISKKLMDIFMISEIVPTYNLSDYGVDSLVAVELRNMLALKAGAEISIFDIIQSASVLALATKVAARSSYLDPSLVPS
ncbi:Highly reducing polyketide synthase [Hyphodiscus hymeniophilus]|uniref:Highly reducing polyketide synthase n=1 Tax=Hyphodiscus hymeniophilus TaxID=353542 RepID=A0A9P6VE99_9HELO|nr:Highly reducing polyketide synthase [Hyphodiscus hymeniophilus]